MKKGVELSMNVIIIAAIGLLVLVILAVLVINSGSGVVKGMKTCNAVGGVCQSGMCDAGRDLGTTGTCSDTAKPYCCKIFSVEETTTTP
jgi:hypothetical protein